MEHAGGVVNREDVDFSMDEPIDDSVGALDHFPDRWIIDLRDNTSGLRKCGQPFDCGDQLLPDQLRVVGRIFLDEPLNGLNIFDCPAGPDQCCHLRS